MILLTAQAALCIVLGMVRATTTKTRADFCTPVREPVGTDDHPLGSAAPIDSFLQGQQAHDTQEEPGVPE